MTQGKDASPKGLRLHKHMFRGLTLIQVDDLITALTAELRALQSAAGINQVMTTENDSHLRTTRRHTADHTNNLRAMRQALIIILEEYRHALRRLNDCRTKLRELEKSQRRLNDEKTQISQRLIAVSEAILWGNEAASRASPVISGRFRNRSDSSSD